MRSIILAVRGAADFDADVAGPAVRAAEGPGALADASLMPRLVAGLTVDRRVLAPSRALAATWRAQAPRLSGPLELQSFRALGRQIRNAAAAIDQIADKELQPMAAN